MLDIASGINVASFHLGRVIQSGLWFEVTDDRFLFLFKLENNENDSACCYPRQPPLLDETLPRLKS
jgi:hypothetical protein